MNEREIFTTRNVAIGLAVLLFIAFIGPATGSATFFYRDFGVLGYPSASYHREMFWRGELPLWNPYSNCGVPFLAQWGTMVLYPFTLIYLLLPFPWSLNFFCLAHLWWGGLGVFCLARRWTQSSPAGAIGAVLFVFNGITLSTLSWPNYTAAFAWMPWILWYACEERRRTAALQNLAEGSKRPENSAPLSIVPAALAGTMQMLVGAPEITLLTWFIVLGIWAVEKRTRRSFLRLAAVIAVIAGLSAIQLLPFFELLSLSQRQTGLVANKWSIPIAGISNYILPMLHAFQTPQGTWFQHEQHFLSSTYLGMPALLLAFSGACAGGRRAKFLFVASIVCVLLALGTNLPAFSLLQKIPILGLSRYPVKFALLLPLTISLCAAYGFAHLNWKRFSREALLLAVVAAVACVVTLLHPYKYDRLPETINNSVGRFTFFLSVVVVIFLWTKSARPLHAMILVALLFMDGRFHIANQNPTTAMKTLTAAIGTRPLPHLGEGRVFISREAENALLKSEVRDLDTDFIGKQLAVWSHLNLIELVPKVNGSATLQLREQKEIQDWLYSGTNVNFEAWLDFLGVTKTTTPGTVVEWTNRLTALPLIRVASNVEPIKGTFEVVTNTQFDPRKSAAIDFISDPWLTGEATIENISIAPHEIKARITAKSAATILVAQSWHPAWMVEVNGKEIWDVRKANHAFLCFRVFGGANSIRVIYRDGNFKTGAIISLLTLTGCCLLGLRRKGS